MLPATTMRPGTKRPTHGEWDDGDRLNLADLMERLHPAWQKQGLCRHHPELSWFPLVAGWSMEGESAKDVCNRCPVKDQCLEHALAVPELTGIWGGVGPRERRRMARR